MASQHSVEESKINADENESYKGDMQETGEVYEASNSHMPQNLSDDEIEGRIDLGADDDDDEDNSADHSQADKDEEGASVHSSGWGNRQSQDGSHQHQDDDDENFDLYEDVGGSFPTIDDDKDGFKDVDLKLKDDDSRRNVRMDTKAPTSESCRVNVSKLHWWTSDADLEEFFASCGKVRKIIFSADPSNGKSLGSATIEFSDR